ncbi:MAG: hypothetical protein FJX77_13125, partial [Armatimonadetes bacterium]|nr:hypothetical protein [Armatimonadota bacterium]
MPTLQEIEGAVRRLPPPDEARYLMWQVVLQLRVVQRAERREVRGEVRVAKLEDGLGPAQVLQAVLAQGLEGGPGGQV